MKKSILASSILALLVASAAHAGATFDTAAGTLNIGADVEFDYTTQSGEQFNIDPNAASIADLTTDAKSDFAGSGRLLLDINGERVLENGSFAGFKLNPTWGQNGSRGADDVWIKFGVKNNWALQAGHFEAQDLSPAGQDTYIAESGTVMYRANYARGRTNDETSGEAQVTFNKTMAGAGFELTAQSQDNGNLVILRPVVTASLSDTVSMAFGLEVPVAGEDLMADTAFGPEPVDSKDWIGAGGSVSFQASDDLTLTARAAYLADDRYQNMSIDSYTAGLNAQFKNFFISALYGASDYADLGDTTETQVYASYKIPAVMDLDNFDIYLGAGWSKAEISSDLLASDITKDDVIGARVRLKYIF